MSEQAASPAREAERAPVARKLLRRCGGLGGWFRGRRCRRGWNLLDGYADQLHRGIGLVTRIAWNFRDVVDDVLAGHHFTEDGVFPV
jgi:hypothetical protein